MPSVSKSQQRYFAGCEHNPQHMQGKCPDMSKGEMHKFSSTKRKGLPERKEKRRKQKVSYPSPK
jgi:hypothetical protein